MRFQQLVKTLGTIMNDFYSKAVDPEKYDLAFKRDKKIIINDDYQRNYVWKDSIIKSELINSILSGYPIGAILFKKIADDSDEFNEVVDGQQRLITLKKFRNDDFKISPKVWNEFMSEYKKEFKQRIDHNEDNDKNILKIFSDYNSDKNRSIGWSDLPKFLQERFDAYNVPVISIIATDKEIRNYFRIVQNQEKLKAGEIINSMDGTPVLNVFSKSEIEEITNKINFNDINQDFLKQMTVLFGLHTGKLSLNMPDKQIVKNSEQINIDKIVGDREFNLKIENFKNDIKNSDFFTFSKTKILSLKLFLLTYFYSESSYYLELPIIEKIKLINSISFLVGRFNSSDLDLKEEIPVSFRKYIEEIWKLSKTTHKRDKIIKTIHQNFDNLLENEDFMRNGWSKLRNKYSPYSE